MAATGIAIAGIAQTSDCLAAHDVGQQQGKSSAPHGASLRLLLANRTAVRTRPPLIDEPAQLPVRVIFDGFSAGCGLVDVRFAAKAPRPRVLVFANASIILQAAIGGVDAGQNPVGMAEHLVGQA